MTVPSIVDGWLIKANKEGHGPNRGLPLLRGGILRLPSTVSIERLSSRGSC
jgi:hypothetical protein